MTRESDRKGSLGLPPYLVEPLRSAVHRSGGAANYATGGLAVTQASDSLICIVPAASAAISLAEQASSGRIQKRLLVAPLGGGIETLFASNWTARVEYL
jgi:opacity protein-like surface antigen